MRACSLMSGTQKPPAKLARKPKPNARRFAPTGRDAGFAVPGSAHHLGWIGEDQLWLEPQPWAIIGGAATPEQRKTLVAALDELVRKPSPIGAMLLSQGDPAMASPAGVLTNGGVWPSINGTLIWALGAGGRRIGLG